MYNICIIHSPADGYLGCFHWLVTMEKCSNEHRDSIYTMPYEVLWVQLDLEVDLFQLSKESPYWLPEWLHQSGLPTAVNKCSPFPTASPVSNAIWGLVLCLVLFVFKSDWDKMKSPSTFNCISLTAQDVKYFFRMLLSCFLSFENSSSMYHFCNWALVFSLMLGFLRDLFILDTSLLSNVVLVSVF